MKSTIILSVISLFGLLLTSLSAEEKPIALKPIEVKNLGLETTAVTTTTFEETIFAIGRIEEIPNRHSVLSSRIPGRITELNAIRGDYVEAGEVLVKVESRQPGDPPPTIPLMAPISGLVLKSHVRLGEPVEPDRELLDIVDLKKVWAVAAVPEQEAHKLEVGTRARIRISATGERVFEGTLRSFGTSADSESGTLDAIFVIDNEDLKLRPGMRAEFSIITSVSEEVMVVPLDALQGDTAKRVVYAEDFELPNVYLRTPVETGRSNDLFAEILSGLFPEDRVVTKGSYFLGFVQGGGASLKEALDAAHGHEHNEDGSEMTADQRAASKNQKAGNSESTAMIDPESINVFFIVLSAILALLLGLSGAKHWSDSRKREKAQDA